VEACSSSSSCNYWFQSVHSTLTWLHKTIQVQCWINAASEPKAYRNVSIVLKRIEYCIAEENCYSYSLIPWYKLLIIPLHWMNGVMTIYAASFWLALFILMFVAMFWNRYQLSHMALGISILTCWKLMHYLYHRIYWYDVRLYVYVHWSFFNTHAIHLVYIFNNGLRTTLTFWCLLLTHS